MHPRHIITPLIGAAIVLSMLALTGCTPAPPAGGLAVLAATRPAAIAKPDTAGLTRDIATTAAAVQQARRTAAVQKRQVTQHVQTIAQLRKVLKDTALPLQERLAEAEKYAEQLEREMLALTATHTALEAAHQNATAAIIAAAEKDKLQNVAISKMMHSLTAYQKWGDAAMTYGASEKNARIESQKKAAKYKSFHQSRWSRWLKWGGILAAVCITLTSAAWVALILYLRTNPTALAARLAGSALSNY